METKNENFPLWKRLGEKSFSSRSSRNSSNNTLAINFDTAKASELQRERISSAWNIEKEDAPLQYHDLVLLPNWQADPATSASEIEPHLVPKSNMHERHMSSQVLIVQARSKSGIKDQNLRWAGIYRLPQGRPHIRQYRFRRSIPRMVYVHYPSCKEHPRAVK